ncbi:MAG: divalent-cation tolerance protein CutA [Planctomycetes bacterium]|nr:divalent-cation tolerance protein CutA [Planctomycetota bacterium]
MSETNHDDSRDPAPTPPGEHSPGGNSTGCLVVLCTVPAERATELADLLVGEHLASCVNLLRGVESRYVWNDRLEVAQETLLVIKTSAARFEDLRARLAERHPYDAPEIVALPVAAGHRPYLDWIVSHCGRSSPAS